MSIIATKTDYIIKTKNVMQNLKDYENSFAIEAKVIWHARCALMQNKDLEDYYADGVLVSVYKTAEGYSLSYMDRAVLLSVYDKMIVDYTIE